MMKKCCYNGRWVNGAITFGLGLIMSCFCPVGLVFFILGVIIVSLGICLTRCR